MSLAFFLIVPSIMIVSILLVHALANRLGLQIYYKTLVAVAVLSFMAIFATTFVAPVVGRGFLLRLGLIILALSVPLTLLNKFFIKRQRDEEERFTEEVKAAYAAEVKKNREARQKNSAPLHKLNLNDSDDPLGAMSRYNETHIAQSVEEAITETKLSDKPVAPTAAEKSVAETESPEEIFISPADAEPVTETKLPDKPVAPPAEKKSVAEKKLPDESVVPTAEEKSVAETIRPDAQGNFPLEKVFKPLSVVKPKEADKPVKLEEKPDAANNFPLDEVFKPLSAVKPKEADKPIKPAESPKRAEMFPLQEVFAPLSTLNLDKIEEITQEKRDSPAQGESEEKLGTLDEILDKAYAERAKGHVWQAIELYKKALERYGNDDYAPFVAIDLGNIYKEQALYSKAIKVYEDALTLPAVKRNTTIKKDFANNLAYLRVVSKVLAKYRASATPFAELSKEILQEVDIEFKKVQINSSQSK